MASNRLETLASQIAQNTSLVNDFLVSNGKKLSFEIDGEPSFPENAPEEALEARRIVREATKELHDLMTGPSEHLRWLSYNCHDLSSLRFIYHFNVADLVPIDGMTSFKKVAEKAGIDEKRVKTIMRHAMTNNIFQEPEAGYIAHTAESSLLVKYKGVRDWVGLACEEKFPASVRLIEAIEKWGTSVSPTQSAYNLAFDTNLPLFEHMSLFPERAERFASVMTEISTSGGYSVQHLVNGFDWQSLEDGSTIVDVGGSTGHASLAIARKARHLNFIVQDRPEIISKGETLLQSEGDSQVKRRMKFEAHDFFTPQPGRKAAIYLLRFILHDYPDRDALTIIKNIVPALEAGTRLVITEGVLPEPHTISKTEERIIRIMDLEMATSFNSGERERADWEALFRKADERLKLKSVRRPTGSVNSVMEVIFEPR